MAKLPGTRNSKDGEAALHPGSIANGTSARIINSIHSIPAAEGFVKEYNRFFGIAFRRKISRDLQFYQIRAIYVHAVLHKAQHMKAQIQLKHAGTHLRLFSS